MSVRSTLPPRRANPARDMGAIALALTVAVAAFGGGYLLLNRVTPLQHLFSLGQPTPVATLAPLTALARIQQIMPTATISLAHPLSDEVDLVTTTSGQNDRTITAAQATAILSLYMRGYGGQTFWRWTDSYPSSGTQYTYEAHALELWVITFRQQASCSTLWQIYAITPAQIVARGAAGGNSSYSMNVSEYPGTGAPPDGTSPC